MRPKQFARYLDRDGGCIHCGDLEAVAPHHRANRGHGGSKRLDRPSNIIVLCSVINGLMESDARIAQLGRDCGWKISRYDEPADIPVYYPRLNAWLRLDDDYGLEIIDTPPPETAF